ncbi:hypothetical protein EMIHUDRAFT_453683 [Emiliania huxleyi CCMP1516]|uniref:Uncharacterized protein n=2 Tax=Emiliania huxleyi TaxID=2903 RepID=A0A0D3I1H5_EMIH1|nr:hypothetical protein EMIHUDRAFT_453683 [Emiliania huxleyi CCMP1516]EOD05110.1 hypothetical protein EMIHUDRAFT_453683 [Emiliania huxleyi CCMP1516]|eukprot:XP_005757539.1 hypothetical protein EMIHUDRAFT_453683 [Emiliania huxleyi CCMP1516]
MRRLWTRPSKPKLCWGHGRISLSGSAVKTKEDVRAYFQDNAFYDKSFVGQVAFNAAEAEEGRRGNIVHAGLIYGFWEVGEGFGSEEWKRGCYHACVRGEAAAVENAIGHALEKLVQELADVYHA